MLDTIAWPNAGLLALSAGAFFLGGLVKGTLGIGLPLVALPLLSLGWPAATGIALMAAPVLISNVWQAWDSGISVQGVRRFLPLIVMLALATLLTVPMTLALSDARCARCWPAWCCSPSRSTRCRSNSTFRRRKSAGGARR